MVIKNGNDSNDINEHDHEKNDGDKNNCGDV